MSGTALFVSPHLDDVAFSCGGTFAALAADGWRCTLLTCFTATVPDPQGFALACQTDKGLPPEVDYMALRRAEDEAAGTVLGAADVVHLPFAEAPHRGYDSAPALFAGVRDDDDVWRDLSDALVPYAGDLVFVCLGLGDHVDHHQVIRALGDRWTHAYADLPYALRVEAPPGGDGPVPPDVPTKLDACAVYATQLGFQFGGEAGMREALGPAPERFVSPAGAGTATRASGPTSRRS